MLVAGEGLGFTACTATGSVPTNRYATAGKGMPLKVKSLT